MKKFKVIVPPTNEQGSYKTMANNRQEALWDYNSCRRHDGFPPLKRMPNGTQYIVSTACGTGGNTKQGTNN